MNKTTVSYKLFLPFLVCCLLNFASCSVYFAATGSRVPDLSKLNKGTARFVVENEVGPPLETKNKASGESVLYSYKTGDQASAGRAVLYLIGDILTLCFAEYIFFPLEISNSGNAHFIAVDYNQNDVMLRMREVKDTNTF